MFTQRQAQQLRRRPSSPRFQSSTMGLRAAALFVLLGTALAPNATEPAASAAVSERAVVPVAVALPVTADMLSYQSMALVAAVITISAAGGIGGGGVLVPVLMISEEIGPHGAIPMSKLTIFGSAVCQLALNWRKRHKLRPDRPLIDFDTTLMLEPPTLLGTVYGVLLNRMTPRWIIAILLLLFLVITCVRTTGRAVRLFAQESADSPRSRASRIRPPDSTGDLEDSAEVSAEVSDAAEATGGAAGPDDDEEVDTTHEPQVPWLVIFKLCLVWCTVLAAAMLRRTAVAECGSWLYWSVLAALTFCIAVLSRATGRSFVRRHKHRVDTGYPFCEGDVYWDDESVVRLPLGCVFAGVLAGMLGVGGGMVMQPLMLELGLLPDVAAATAAFMMLFTASSTTLQFTLNGMLDWERNIALPLIGVAGAAVGWSVVGRLVRRYNRLSLIIFPVGIIMGLSALLMGYTTLADLKEHGAGSFHGPCNNLNEAYNVSSPKPGMYNASNVLDGEAGKLASNLPHWAVVAAVVVATCSLLLWCLRSIKRACKHPTSGHSPLPGVEDSSTKQAEQAGEEHYVPADVQDAIAAAQQQEEAEGGGTVDNGGPPSRDSEAETTSLVDSAADRSAV